MKLLETLRGLRELRSQATDGEWSVRHRCFGCTIDDDESLGMGLDIHGPPEPDNRGQFAKAADAKFVVAAANTDFAAMVVELEWLRALLQAFWPYVNRRRGSLINLKVNQPDLMPQKEQDELARLQSLAGQFLNLMAPLPVDKLEEVVGKLVADGTLPCHPDEARINELEAGNKRLRELVREAYTEPWGELSPNEYREEYWEQSAAKATLDALDKEGSDA